MASDAKGLVKCTQRNPRCWGMVLYAKRNRCICPDPRDGLRRVKERTQGVKDALRTPTKEGET